MKFHSSLFLRAAALFALAVPLISRAASDVTISAGPTAGGSFAGANPSVFTPTASTAVADSATIQLTLDAGTSVTVNTASAAGGNGDLLVSAPITKTAGANATLTLNAVRNLTLDGLLSAAAGAMPLTLSAGRAISSSQAIASNGSNITINTVQPFTLGSSLDAGAGQVLLQAGTLQSSSPQTVTASAMQVSPGAAIKLSGFVTGNLSVAGTLSAGTAAGFLQVNGDLTLQPTATTIVDLAGTSQGSNYDSITASVSVAIAGGLQVKFLDGFEDAIVNGHSFVIAQGSSVTGTFSGLPDGARVVLPDDHGSLRITYTTSSVILSDWQPVIQELTWDPGDADAGTQVFSNVNTRAGRHYFHINAQATDIGAWKSRLTAISGEANLYLRHGYFPQSTADYHYKSERAGSDGFVLPGNYYSAGQDWYFMVNATAGAQWSIFTGRAWVQELGPLAWTDSVIANGQYDIGEPALPSGTGGNVTLGPEGLRFFRTVVPTGTPAWSLWLHGDTRPLAVRKNFVPFPNVQYDRQQAGQMLVVAPYLEGVTSTYFLAVTGEPGEAVNLDSHIQEVTVMDFNATTPSTAVNASPYRVYRVDVPEQHESAQLKGWDVAVTPSLGDANVCVRRDNAPAEFDNDAFSEVSGISTTDSITLVPDFLTDGTWFITVYGTGAYTFTLKNAPPTLTPLDFTDTEVNILQPNRAGWRFYELGALTIPAQLGSLGWELNLVGPNVVPGTEIALRRNNVPSRWRKRTGGSTAVQGDSRLDPPSSTSGFLQRPGHQADIWYVGIYQPDQAIGQFTLQTGPIVPAPMRFDPTSAGPNPSTLVVTGQEPGRWRYAQIVVPSGVLGWDVRLGGVSGARPRMVIRRDALPDGVGTSYFWPPYYSYYPSAGSGWPSGNQWDGGLDWTGRYYDVGAPTYERPQDRQVMGMGRPLEPGTYYVGVYNPEGQTSSYTIVSRGIGAAGSGLYYSVEPTLALTGGSAAVNVGPREAKYFKVQVPANTASWEVTLSQDSGELLLLVRAGVVPDFNAGRGGDASVGYWDAQVEMQKAGPERYLMLPPSGQDYLSPGDYYLAVVGEGANPPDANTIGTGNSSGTLTSRGVLAVDPIGPLPPAPAFASRAVNLEAGEIDAYSFEVPVGTQSLEVRLENPTGAPVMNLVQGVRLPVPGSYTTQDYYGYDGGEGGLQNGSILTVANPVAGPWRVLVRATTGGGSEPLPATTTLVISALTPIPVDFDRGSYSMPSQPPQSWRYFKVEVPTEAMQPGVLGWDVRLGGVSGARPRMVIRRDALPDGVGTSYFWPPYYSYYPSAGSGWPSGNQWDGGLDWTGRYYDVGAPTYERPQDRQVMGMGRPLEPGTYYVGVYNPEGQTSSYTIVSRGIGAAGAGLYYSVEPTLALTGGSAAVNVGPREAKYFKVQVPANTASWEVTLSQDSGELLLLVRAGVVPDFNAGRGGDASVGYWDAQVEMQKAGPERYLMLPPSGQDYLSPGDYYLAVVGEGANPPDANTIGTGNSSGTLTSRGVLAVDPIGPLPPAPAFASRAVNLEAGEIDAYSFEVPVGTQSLEVRLDNPTGAPVMNLVQGVRLPVPGSYTTQDYYGYDGGEGGLQNGSILTVANPVAGPWRVLIRATTGGGSEPLPATTTLVVRQKQNVLLNFAASLNGNGFSHTDSRQLIHDEYQIYQVAVPTTVASDTVLGWVIETDVLQGGVSLQIYKDFANPDSGIVVNATTAVIVPPFLTPGDTWYVRVRGIGLTNYTISSRPVSIEERPYTPGGPGVWPMPGFPNAIFGDSGRDSAGLPLPGDGGTDLGQGRWHFYAVDVSEGNAGLLRTELQSISGNPDLFIREDGVPTTSHNSQPYNGSALYHRSLTATVTEYGNWVPFDNRTGHQLQPGRWYLGVVAAGNSNARYRLKVSTGNVTDLALKPSLATVQVPATVTNQLLADNDWRYYRFTVPQDAPNNWELTFSQEVGDVVMWLRDSVPPGQSSSNSNQPQYIVSWSNDSKNQGPYHYSGQDAPGTYPFATPPLRPGHTYYAGFRSNNSATFIVSSDTSGGTLGVVPALAFYNPPPLPLPPSLLTTVPANSSALYRIVVPPEGTRLKWTSIHSGAVTLRLEQGSPAAESGGQHYITSGENSTFNQGLALNSWPWQPNQTYYLRLVNSSASGEPVTITIDGKNAQTEDEDNDGLPDAWEQQYWQTLGYGPNDDNDNDGNSNAVEFADGTNPTDANSAKYTLTVLAKNGTATASPVQAKYDKGAVVTLTNTPDAGYSFLNWVGGPFRADDFALKAAGTVTLPGSGTWTFGASSDDGVRVTVNGITVVSDDGPHTTRDSFGEITLPAGSYALEVLYFERSGGENLELFSAAGSKTAFDSSFKLVGDTANGGLAVTTLDGALAVPGFTVRQVESLSVPMYNLSYADALLAGSYTRRQDITAISPELNFVTYDANEGRFGNNLDFPLNAEIRDNPVAITMNGHYTITALNSLPLGPTLDNTALVWTAGDSAPWLGENSATAFDGVDHAGSGPVGDGQSSTLQTTVAGPGTLTFYWKVSAASGDNLAFQVDGAPQAAISEEVPWTQQTYNVTEGIHTLKWIYAKDGGNSAGSDRGWVDQVVFTSTAYETWVAGFGLTGNDALPEADGEGDGLTNLTEFACNLNPTQPGVSVLEPGTGTAGLPSIRLVETGADRHLEVEFVRRKAGGVVYTVQFGDSPAGASMQPATFPAVVTSIDAEWERVVVEDQVTIGGATNRFGRLLFSKP